MTRRWRSCLLLALAAVVAPTRQAGAQLGCSGATCTVEISLPVNQVMRLTLSSSSVSLGTPSETDYQNGYRDVSGAAVTATVKSNRAFSVSVNGAVASFGYAGTLPNPNKPASDLRWATSAAGLPGSTNTMGTAATLLTGNAGTASQSLYLRTLWSFATGVPGTYSLAIAFTLSAP